MAYFNCCSSDNKMCCCCSRQNQKEKVNSNRSQSMDYIHSVRRKKSYRDIQSIDELMDITLSQKRVNMFVPVPEDIEFDSCVDYVNVSTIIHPFSMFRFFWDSFIMIVLVFTCFEIPLTLSFRIETSNLYSSYGVFVLLIDIVLCTDIIFNFRTGYYHRYDELKLVSDPKKIAKKYFKHWFFIDFITSFPIEFMLPSQLELGNAPAILRAFRIVRLVRLFKLVRFFRMLKLVNTFLREFMGSRSSLIIRLLRLVAYMILAAHFAACLWYYVGLIHYDDPEGSWLVVQNVDIDNKFDAYLTSIYWSIVTLFTTGYGDIIPSNKDEKLVAAAVILLGTCFFAYLIGAVGSLVAEGDRIRSIREQKFEEAQAFCAAKHLPASLSRAVMTHTSYFWKRNFVYDDLEILQSLPFGLQYEILSYYGNKVFKTFKAFDSLPNTTKGLLALKLKQFSMNKGCTLYNHGDIAKEFYIQRTGSSCLIIPDNSDHTGIDETLLMPLEDLPDIGTRTELQRGDIFGHIGFVKGKRNGTLYCETWSEFYSLSKIDLQEVLAVEHPKNWKAMNEEINKCMKLYKYNDKREERKNINQRKLSINLNDRKRKNSKFLSLFSEDSVERNDKILFEYTPANNIELTQESIHQFYNNDNSDNSDCDMDSKNKSNSGAMSDSQENAILPRSKTYPQKTKHHKMTKKRRMGKQSGGITGIGGGNTRKSQNTNTNVSHTNVSKKIKKKEKIKENEIEIVDKTNDNEMEQNNVVNFSGDHDIIDINIDGTNQYLQFGD